MIVYGSSPWLLVIPITVTVIIFSFVGIIIEKNKPRISNAMLIVSLAITIIYVVFFSTTYIYHGSIGVDKNDDIIYAEGQHYIRYTAIEKIDLRGSITVNENIEILYNLSPEEFEILGREFKEKIKEQTVLEIDDIHSSLKIVSIPKGVNPSHITIVAKLTPFLYIKTPNIIAGRILL
jgi:hypothetical protein